jgi:uncharacterized protein (DUF2249 family)
MTLTPFELWYLTLITFPLDTQILASIVNSNQPNVVANDMQVQDIEDMEWEYLIEGPKHDKTSSR